MSPASWSPTPDPHRSACDPGLQPRDLGLQRDNLLLGLVVLRSGFVPLVSEANSSGLPAINGWCDAIGDTRKGDAAKLSQGIHIIPSPFFAVRDIAKCRYGENSLGVVACGLGAGGVEEAERVMPVKFGIWVE